jgi:non-homologous end joining protein Ku
VPRSCWEISSALSQPRAHLYRGELLAHLKAKQAGAVQERKPTFAAPRRVINLMEALRRSVAEDKKLSAAPARKRA